MAKLNEHQQWILDEAKRVLGGATSDYLWCSAKGNLAARHRAGISMSTLKSMEKKGVIRIVDDTGLFAVTDAAIAQPVSVAADACPFCDNSPCQCTAIRAENAAIDIEYARGLHEQIATLTRERDAAKAEADALREERREVEDLLMQNGHHTPTVRLADQVNAVYRQLSAESERAATADAPRKLVGEIQEVAEDALGDWYTVRDLISEFVDPDAALVTARQRADWTLTPQQRAYMDQRKPFVENAYAANDMDFMRDLAASDEYKTLFGGMSWDEAYARYEDAALVAARQRADDGTRLTTADVRAQSEFAEED